MRCWCGAAGRPLGQGVPAASPRSRRPSISTRCGASRSRKPRRLPLATWETGLHSSRRRHRRSRPRAHRSRCSRSFLIRSSASRSGRPLAEGGAPYAIPPRLTLRNGLSMQDEGAWRDAILKVTRAWRPFTVRLRPPEVMANRMLSLAPVGDGVANLQTRIGELADLGRLRTARRRRRRSGVDPRGHVHRRDAIGIARVGQCRPRPGAASRWTSRATTLYTVAEADGDSDLPIDAFVLGG